MDSADPSPSAWNVHLITNITPSVQVEFNVCVINRDREAWII